MCDISVLLPEMMRNGFTPEAFIACQLFWGCAVFNIQPHINASNFAFSLFCREQRSLLDRNYNVKKKAD
jgi:hypothetical protein